MRTLSHSLAMLILVAVANSANAAYTEKWSVFIPSNDIRFTFCSAGNTDGDPQAELLFGRGNGTQFSDLLLYDGASGSLEWSLSSTTLPMPFVILTGMLETPNLSSYGYQAGPQLVDVDQDGMAEIVLVGKFGGGLGPYLIKVFESDVTSGAPEPPDHNSSTLQVSQNYPNPFQSSTTIEYDATKGGVHRIRVFDVQGRLVRTLDQQEGPVGHNSLTWDGTSDQGDRVPSGLYFYSVDDGTEIKARKLIVIE